MNEIAGVRLDCAKIKLRENGYVYMKADELRRLSGPAAFSAVGVRQVGHLC